MKRLTKTVTPLRSNRKYTRRKKQKLISGGSKDKMNCNPVVKSKTLSPETCYTKDAVTKMKHVYNSEIAHKKGKVIHSKEPKQIIHDLKDAFQSECTKKPEDCIVKQLPSLKEELPERLFAPYQPEEWKSNHREWLSNYDIMNVLEQYEDAYPNFKLLGPTSIDFNAKLSSQCVDETFCKFHLKEYLGKGKTNFGMIFNLSKHNEAGTHWVSLFLHIDGRHSFIFYFDSVGVEAPKEIVDLVQRIQTQCKDLGIPLRFIQNRKEHQYGNTECGMYSLYFLISFLTSELESKNRSMNQLIYHFTKRRIPDKTMERFRDKYFNAP